VCNRRGVGSKRVAPKPSSNGNRGEPASYFPAGRSKSWPNRYVSGWLAPSTSMIFPHELDCSGTAPPAAAWGGEHQPGILRAARLILHNSMRGNDLLVMTANPDVGSRLLALLRRQHVLLCDRPSCR